MGHFGRHLRIRYRKIPALAGFLFRFGKNSPMASQLCLLVYSSFSQCRSVSMRAVPRRLTCVSNTFLFLFSFFRIHFSLPQRQKGGPEPVAQPFPQGERFAAVFVALDLEPAVDGLTAPLPAPFGAALHSHVRAGRVILNSLHLVLT